MGHKSKSMQSWQENTLGDLISYFEPNEDIVGLLLFGSFSKPEFRPDMWSDIDILLVVRDNRLDEFSLPLNG